jgi:hypothetical protein
VAISILGKKEKAAGLKKNFLIMPFVEGDGCGGGILVSLYHGVLISLYSTGRYVYREFHRVE